MQQLRTFEIKESLGSLQAASRSRSLPERLTDPMRAIVADIALLAAQRPLSIYLCASDDDREARDYFGYVLARALSERLPDCLLVDCDFLSVGMSGIVPLKDGMGFLDLLLYGSSLGAISQKTDDGVTVVGAGSFPVSRKSPFMMDAFQSASRYLLSQSRCVIFCGPCEDDKEAVHPITACVSLPIIIGTGTPDMARLPDPIEDKVSSVKDSEVWSVHLTAPDESLFAASAAGAAEAAGVPDDRRAEESPEEEPAGAERVAGPEPGTEPAEEPERPASPPQEREGELVDSNTARVEQVSQVRLAERRGSSALPKVVTTVLALSLIGFFLWWLYLTKSIRDLEELPQQLTPAVAEQTGESPPPTPADTVEAQPVEEPAPTEEPVPTEVVAASEPSEQPAAEDEDTPAGDAVAETRGEDTEAVRPTGEAVRATVSVAESIVQFAGRYVVHVSSFRRMENARVDAEYLAERGHSAIIVPVDLGERGRWFRVYVGPVESMPDASELKKSLDEYPRVKSTRITRVPG